MSADVADVRRPAILYLRVHGRYKRGASAGASFISPNETNQRAESELGRMRLLRRLRIPTASFECADSCAGEDCECTGGTSVTMG